MFDYLLIFLFSALPVIELRGSIPLAILAFGFSPLKAFVVSVLGSIFPVIFILIFLDWFSGFLMSNFDFFKKFFSRIFEYTRNKHAKKLNYWGNFAPIIIAALPLPIIGGAWTASLAAFVFGINKKHAFLSIAIGTVISGLIVTAVMISGIGLMRLIFKSGMLTNLAKIYSFYSKF